MVRWRQSSPVELLEAREISKSLRSILEAHSIWITIHHDRRCQIIITSVGGEIRLKKHMLY